MPPKKIKNVLVMLTNVGSTSLELNSVEEEPFIDKAKCAMKLLIEKKLFLQPKDQIGIITMGDEESHNDDGMEYVKTYNDNLLVPNWEMLKYTNKLTASKNRCNWVEGFHVALNFIQKEVTDTSNRVFLVVFNNFKEPEDTISSYDPCVIINDVKEINDLHLLIVGENPITDREWRKANASYSEKLAVKIMKECGGQYEQINSFIEERRFYITQVNPMAWKFNLDIAELCIPCASYVKVAEDSKLGPWKMKASNDTEDLLNTGGDSVPLGTNASRVVKESLKLDAQRNELFDKDIMNAYKFGGQYIPVSEEDEETMKYVGDQKGMSIYGFVQKNEIRLEHWSGKGSRIIVPQSADDAAAFYSLVQAMVENKYVAIVRKVYADKNLPKMGALFPNLVDGEVWCLVHVELPYSDEVRFIEKKPITSLNKSVTEEKIKALDDWIDSMTVPTEDMTYLNSGLFPNIPQQYHWNVMADRVLNPEKPLLPLPSYLRKYLTPPEELSRKAKPHLDKLNELFIWSNDPVNQKKQSATTSAAKSSGNVYEAETQQDKDVPSDKHVSDEEFFSAEAIDLDADELDNM